MNNALELTYKNEPCGCGHDHTENPHEDHGCNCGHDHRHDDEDHGCDCGHDHRHDDEDHGCDCGHEHRHGHEEQHGCNCGHDHHHDAGSPSVTQHTVPETGMIKKVYLLENLGCANCAAKMEKRILELDGIAAASITFTTKQLRITAKDPSRYLARIQSICSSIESEVTVVEKPSQVRSVPTDEKKAMSVETKSLLGIIAGAALFILGEILEKQGAGVAVVLPIYIAAYIILGGKIVLTAFKNIFKGQIFDENFLMSIATLGAFAIQEYPEAVGVMLFYRVGEYFEHRAVEKSRSQIMGALDMRPEVVNLLVDEEIQVIRAESAQVGDLLLVRPGDRIPLDGVIIEGESRIDTSPITGEPVPVKAGINDEVTSGCVNTSGQLKMRVAKVLAESMVSRILDSVENAAASKPKIDHFITRFARIYTPIVVVLALGTAIIPSLFTGNWNYWIYTALTFLVMSCPCALVLSVPLAFFSGIGAGSKRGILFKGGVSLESMSHVKTVVMDKTGTITEGNFVLQNIVSINDLHENELLTLCASCEQSSTHPIANSIVTAAKEKHLVLESPATLEEIAGHGIRATLAAGEVLCGNRKLMEKFNISLEQYRNDTFGAEVLIAVNGSLAGYIVISDTIKADAADAIAKLKKLNIRTAMLTGDSEGSARFVAHEIGLDEVHAKLLPQDKLTELTAIRNNYGSVMFVGDGINDAPVLAGADVGAAMGSGADAAIEAADVVFMTSGMDAIPQSISIAKASTQIAMQNVVFALIIKVIVMILGLCGFASMWMAVFADTGVAMLCVLNSVRILYKKQ